MAWIESHQELAEHPKLFHLASLTGLSMDACIGRLHRLWWWCLKFAEDGDLSRYQSVQIPPIETDEFREHLRTSKWLDGDLIHDWIEYAGVYLTKKYNTGNVPRLKQIWQRHGFKYGKGKGKFTKQEVSKQRVERELKVNIPNLTRPNQTIPNPTRPNHVVSVRRQGLEDFVVTDEIRAWAREKFAVEIPDDVIREFKDHWRKEPDKKLRIDWTATFQSQIRKLVAWKVLKPIVADTGDWKTKFLAGDA